MAKGSNTWCKKLMTKRKAQIVKDVFGPYKPLMGRTMPAIKDEVTRKGRLIIINTPERDVPPEHEKSTAPRERKLAPLPRVSGWKPRADKCKIAERQPRCFRA